VYTEYATFDRCHLRKPSSKCLCLIQYEVSNSARHRELQHTMIQEYIYNSLTKICPFKVSKVSGFA